ncbi:MAG: 30S ribosome-binding factor RbfA [Chloroflexi bacterium]|nr:30S ribosome-binding factor RbfA [Chloroflexota bacterium]
MSIKQGRMSDRIHHILSALLLREVSDPRLREVSITEVKLDPELTTARVYVIALGDATRETEVTAAFRRANGYLRRELGKRIRLRHTPELHFRWDHTFEQADRINKIISNLEIPDAALDSQDDED